MADATVQPTHCAICGKKLTSARSIARGIGPECAGLVAPKGPARPRRSGRVFRGNETPSSAPAAADAGALVVSVHDDLHMDIIDALQYAKLNGYTHASDVTYGYRISKIDSVIARIRRQEDWKRDRSWTINALGVLKNDNGDEYNLYKKPGGSND